MRVRQQDAVPQQGAAAEGRPIYVCSVAARDGECGNKRLWNAKDVERHLVHQIDARRIAAAFDPAAKRTPPSPREYDVRIADLTAMMGAALDAVLRNKGKKLAIEYENRAETLLEEIDEVRKRRGTVEAAPSHHGGRDRQRRRARGQTRRLHRRTEENSEDRHLAAAADGVLIVFRPHAIVGLIELPEEPKTTKGVFGGIPGSIEVREVEERECKHTYYFLRHVFFRDVPDEMAALGGGKGLIPPRFT